MRQHRSYQSGVALLGALAVLAIASLLAYAMLDSGRLAMQQSASNTRSAQAQLLSEGLYDYALVALAQDAANSALDSNTEAWAVTLPDLPIERGFLSGRLRDLNGRLNVNALWRDGQRDGVTLRRMERLLIHLQLDVAIAYHIADAIDPDSLSQDGAEDPSYIQRNRRAPNRYLSDISELQHIVGIDANAYALLAPHVSALPPNAALNINTASVPVLLSLSDGFGEELARRVWQDGQARYGNVSELVITLDQAGIRLNPDEQKDLSVESQYFAVLARVRLDGADYFSQAILQRSAGTLGVLQRRRGVF
jgi:general secretion pathway protein K